ncbi:unnamed protein product [Rotaria sp. Silwood2]|nr:unnamed protein product [Rotaria sp. Silwood2]CAF2871236.1 unnamed protein product [Rotaria sp. Silwood2]CAF3026460.1 unnamed protein product [Rotaria sp. Silwood2]CAF3894750.1 unnamed protein product [Rotaria sp. Silwood2]CAF4061806.1 unnamed protein product [Rotaria sp. Silwood2]
MNCCGPFPKTPQTNIFALCLTDYFTKLVTATPLQMFSTQVVTEATSKEYVYRYGVPTAVISDQGTSFKNQLMFSLSQLLGYHHILCTSHHPQSNGQVERFNSTFVTQIAKSTHHEFNN